MGSLTLLTTLCVVSVLSYTTAEPPPLNLPTKPFYYPGAIGYHGSACHTGYVYRQVKRKLYVHGGLQECYGKVREVYCHGTCTRYQYEADRYKQTYYLTRQGLQHLIPKPKVTQAKGQGQPHANDLGVPDHAHDKGQGQADPTHNKCPVDPMHKGPGPVDPMHKGPGPVDPMHKGPGPVDPMHKEPGPVDPMHKGPGPVDPMHKEPGPVDPMHKGPGPVDPSHDKGPGPVDHTHEGQGHDGGAAHHPHPLAPAHCCGPAVPRWRLVRVTLQCGYYWRGVVMFQQLSPGCVCAYC